MPTLHEAITFTATEATSEDLDRIFDALKTRRKALQAARAALVQIGDKVTIGEITPKALIGLKGEVVSIDATRCDVLLDTDSTKTLSYGRTKFAYAASHAPDGQYKIGGVPLSCCMVQA